MTDYYKFKCMDFNYYILTEAVFVDLNNTRYKWDNAQLEIIPRPSQDQEIAIGIQYEGHTMKLEFKALKAIFFDLGDTLVKYDGLEDKLLAFDHTNAILSNLEKKGIALGIISDGNRQYVQNLLDDQNFLLRFKVIVMSDDNEVGGIRKPNSKIFDIAISKMRAALGEDLHSSETVFITETIDHFKVYNILYASRLKEIIPWLDHP